MGRGDRTGEVSGPLRYSPLLLPTLKVLPVYVLLAVSSALLYGGWKFGLGLYRDRVNANAIVLVSAASAAVVYIVLGVLGQSLAFDGHDVLPGLLGGTLNVIGTLLVVKAFERGKLGVVSGVAATYAVVPLLYSLAIGEPLAASAGAGIVLCFVGLLLFLLNRPATGAAEATQGGSTLAIGLACISALFWGLAILVLDFGSRVSLTGTLLVSQAPQIVVPVAGLLIARTIGGLNRGAIGGLAVAGVALALAELSFYGASNEGNIGIVSVIGALSPLVTALLALVFLKERLTRVEVLALVVVLTGACLVVA